MPVLAKDLDGLEAAIDIYGSQSFYTYKEFKKSGQTNEQAQASTMYLQQEQAKGQVLGGITGAGFSLGIATVMNLSIAVVLRLAGETILEELAGVPLKPNIGDGVQAVVKSELKDFTFKNSFNKFKKHIYGLQFDYKSKTWKPTSKGPDMPFMSYNEYKSAANNLMKSSGDNILSFTTNEGTLFKFDKKTGYFGIADSDGNITTFYKPDKGEDYFKEQIKKHATKAPGTN